MRLGASAAGFQAPPWQRTEQPASQEIAAASSSNQVAKPDSTAKAFTIAAAIAWPLTIMLLFATSWDYWWLMFLPVMLSSVAGKFQHDNRQGSPHSDPHGSREP